ncbi:MAG: hypothetical protein J7M21_05950 [Planctomycetes bacterium]|nr:hypothetical protein [Planctomycetota bacterium]
MKERFESVRIRVDGYTRACLGIIAVLLTVLILALWADGVDVARAARAAGGIPDSGQQRQMILAELKKNTAAVEKLARLFETGAAKVQVSAGGGKQAGKNRVPIIPGK